MAHMPRLLRRLRRVQRSRQVNVRYEMTPEQVRRIAQSVQRGADAARRMGEAAGH